MIVVDMRSVELPYVYLTYFGGIVVDKYKLSSNTELWIIHVATLSPIDLTNVKQLKDITEMFAHIAEKMVYKKSEVDYTKRKALISGRVPLVLLPHLLYIAYSITNSYTDCVYVFDPKIRKGYNCYLDTIDIPEESLPKLLGGYDELVKQLHSR